MMYYEMNQITEGSMFFNKGHTACGPTCLLVAACELLGVNHPYQLNGIQETLDITYEVRDKLWEVCRVGHPYSGLSGPHGISVAARALGLNPVVYKKDDYNLSWAFEKMFGFSIEGEENNCLQDNIPVITTMQGNMQGYNVAGPMIHHQLHPLQNCRWIVNVRSGQHWVMMRPNGSIMDPATAGGGFPGAIRGMLALPQANGGFDGYAGLLIEVS